MRGLVISVFLCLSASSLSFASHVIRRSYPSNGNGTMIGKEGALDRINDRLTALVAVHEQQYKKLEAIEYKLTRIEVINQEHAEATKTELRDLNRRTQNADWIASKSESTLDQLKNEMEALRHSFENNGLRMAAQYQQPSSNNVDNSEKLTGIATLLTSARAALYHLEQESKKVAENLTLLANSQREIRQHLQVFPTKQHLHGAIHNLRQQPVYAVMTNQGHSAGAVPNSCASGVVLKSGIFKINVNPVKDAFYVMCDADTDGGGWTVIQRRKDGSINFNRNWLEYKFGFGNLAGEFFIGLDKLHDMTSSQLHELRIELEDFDGQKKHARYNSFSIGGEKEDYAINILGEYEGTAGDGLSYSAAHKFSTFDADNDGWLEGNCAQAHTGAWWYNACEMSNLNGQYLSGDVAEDRQYQGIYWNEFHGSKYSLKSVKMMIRPLDRIFSPSII